MKRHLALALLAASVAFGSTAAPAQMRQDGASTKRSQANKPVVRVPRAVGTKIACPKGGCIRIPANCIVTMEENWDGGPTGNELIACP